MDGQNELEQLDESLSEMTDLLLAGEAGGDAELQGDYEAPPRTRGAAAGEEPPASPGSEVEQAQAAVAAAMRNVAEALDADSEPPGGRGEAEDASLREPAREEGDRPGVEDPEEAESTMRAVSQQVAQADAEASQQPAPAGVEPAADAAEAELGQFTDETAPSAPQAQDDAAAGSPVGSEPMGAPEPSAGDPAQPAALPQIPIAHAVPATAVPVTSSEAASAGAASPAGPRAGRAAGMIGSGVCTLVAIALEPIGARLGGASRTLRHSLAWLAVWTAFNAACVWAYIALFRTAAPGHGEGTATHIVGAVGSEESPPEAGESEKRPTHAPESASHGR